MKFTAAEFVKLIEAQGASITVDDGTLIIRDHRQLPLHMQLMLLSSRPALFAWLHHRAEAVISTDGSARILEAEWSMFQLADRFGDARWSSYEGDDRMHQILDEQLSQAYRPPTPVEQDRPVFWRTVTGRVIQMVKGDKRKPVEVPGRPS